MTARILLVEDDPFLALDLERRLAQAGIMVAGPAASNARALALLAESGCDAAILDVHLGKDDTSEPVALELLARGIPFVTVTGYSHEQLPVSFAGSTVLSKPIRYGDLMAELQRCLNAASKRG